MSEVPPPSKPKERILNASLIACIVSACVSILTNITTIGYSFYTRTSDARDKIVDAFVSQADGFEAAAYHFVSPILRGGTKPDDKVRDILLDNITGQTQSLSQLNQFMTTPVQYELLNDYRNDLIGMRKVIVSSDNGQLDSFYDQSKILLTERAKLMKALKKS